MNYHSRFHIEFEWLIEDIIKTFGVEKFGSPLFFPDAGKKEEGLGK